MFICCFEGNKQPSQKSVSMVLFESVTVCVDINFWHSLTGQQFLMPKVQYDTGQGCETGWTPHPSSGVPNLHLHKVPNISVDSSQGPPFVDTLFFFSVHPFSVHPFSPMSVCQCLIVIYKITIIVEILDYSKVYWARGGHRTVVNISSGSQELLP